MRIGRWRAELWLVPGGAEITDHQHPHLDAWLLPLWGSMTWRREGRQREVGPVGPFRPMPVRAGVTHGASARTRSGFLTLEHWQEGAEVSSASKDLQRVA
jgi:hypothetical protein